MDQFLGPDIVPGDRCDFDMKSYPRSGEFYRNSGSNPRNQVCNYPPVSLTSIFSKFMESIVKDHLMSHLLANNLATFRLPI